MDWIDRTCHRGFYFVCFGQAWNPSFKSCWQISPWCWHYMLLFSECMLGKLFQRFVYPLTTYFVVLKCTRISFRKIQSIQVHSCDKVVGICRPVPCFWFIGNRVLAFISRIDLLYKNYLCLLPFYSCSLGTYSEAISWSFLTSHSVYCSYSKWAFIISWAYICWLTRHLKEGNWDKSFWGSIEITMFNHWHAMSCLKQGNYDTKCEWPTFNVKNYEWSLFLMLTDFLDSVVGNERNLITMGKSCTHN